MSAAADKSQSYQSSEESPADVTRKKLLGFKVSTKPVFTFTTIKSNLKSTAAEEEIQVVSDSTGREYQA